MATSLEATFHGPRLFRLGDPIVVGFRLANTGASPLLVLARGTPLEGLLAPCLQLRCEGAPLPYDGIMVKRGPVAAGEYVRIEAGQAVLRELEIHRAYAVSGVGRYQVDYEGAIPDHLPAAEGASLAARVARIHDSGGAAPIQVRAAPWSFEVVSGSRPLPTDGARARGEAG